MPAAVLNVDLPAMPFERRVIFHTDSEIGDGIAYGRHTGCRLKPGHDAEDEHTDGKKPDAGHEAERQVHHRSYDSSSHPPGLHGLDRVDIIRAVFQYHSLNEPLAVRPRLMVENPVTVSQRCQLASRSFQSCLPVKRGQT